MQYAVRFARGKLEIPLLATPPAVSSGESATLRLPLSIINDDAHRTRAAERPRGRAELCLFSIERNHTHHLSSRSIKSVVKRSGRDRPFQDSPREQNPEMILSPKSTRLASCVWG